MSRPDVDFEYAPVNHGGGDDDGESGSLVVATARATAVGRLVAALESGGQLPDGLPPVRSVAVAFERAPLFWYRLELTAPVTRAAVSAALERAGIEIRYVASVHKGSTALGAPLADDDEERLAADPRWSTRKGPIAELRHTDSFWFLQAGAGVNVVEEGRHAHDGRGMRLAVIDDDGESAEELALDAEIPVGIEAVPRSHSHGPQMVAWAVGARGLRPMAGVAPGASPRLYVIPKPGVDVLSLAVAFARAVVDGADVIVCATYVEGASSPMLSDALDLAVRHGRGGLGTAVVLPTGREASSPSYAVRASWSLSLADPACDARVFCVAPGGKDGGWFTWKDRRGAFHPFGNRGPAVRWSAPGDDVVYPFGAVDRTHHAESSGAAAIAAGVLLCVLGANPALHVGELDAVITRTAAAVAQPENARLHRADAAPLAVDADGHNAKQGYGRMDARAACATVTCPVAGALVAIGDPAAAARWLRRRAEDGTIGELYTAALSGWLARAALADSGLAHALRTLVRHCRLVVARPERLDAQVDGALLRHLVLCLEAALFTRSAPAAPASRLRRELQVLRDELRAIGRSRDAIVAFEQEAFALARELFLPGHDRALPSGIRLRPAAVVAASESSAASVNRAASPPLRNFGA